MLTTVFFLCLFVCFFLGGWVGEGGAGSEIGSKQNYLMKRMSDEKSKITIVYNLITSPSIPSEDHQKTDQVLVLFYSNIFEMQIFCPTKFSRYILLFTNFEFCFLISKSKFLLQYEEMYRKTKTYMAKIVFQYLNSD